MNEKKYLIKAVKHGNVSYVYCLYRTYFSTNADIGDGIELTTLTQAVSLKEACEQRNRDGYKLSIIVVETTVKDVEQPQIREAE